MDIILLIFAAIWAVLLFGGFIFGSADDYRRMPIWTRMWSSVALVAAAGGVWWLRPDGYHLLIFIGMGFGLLGDLFMADLIKWPRLHVLGGMGSFGLGHIAYIAACFQFANTFDSNQLAAAVVGRWAAWLIWIAAGVIGWWLLVYRGAPDGNRTALHWAALPYAGLLASTAGVATGMMGLNAGFAAFAIGAGLFLFSDLLIAVEMFNNRRFRLMGDVIWLTYGPAQALIVFTTYFLV